MYNSLGSLYIDQNNNNNNNYYYYYYYYLLQTNSGTLNFACVVFFIVTVDGESHNKESFVFCPSHKPQRQFLFLCPFIVFKIGTLKVVLMTMYCYSLEELLLNAGDTNNLIQRNRLQILTGGRHTIVRYFS